MDSTAVTTPDGTRLHVGVHGAGPDVVVLSGGPGCVHYLSADELAPQGFRAWFPEPRGVGRSGGGPHTMAQAVADLEAVRDAAGVEQWTVLGHSWGSDLAVRYALDHPESVAQVVGIAGHGLHKDRTWSAQYEAGKATDAAPDIAWSPEVHAALQASFLDWIHEPGIWRKLADSPVPMTFLAAGADIRPSWPLAQLGALVPEARFETVPDVPHDFWHTHPQLWREVVTAACGTS
ncbi:alpha/beta fold hydrolase [Promicromonospora sp. NPDC059942]|uniref:alpha/beta fold hydrolase n=1 Tax=Promicromonospora sp. NPDC059942 TaxID=3347009 RepID=UPI00364CBFD8